METETEAKELESQALSVPEQAKKITISDTASYELAGQIVLRVKDLRKKINDAFDPIIAKAFATHREAKAQKTKVEAPLIEAESFIKPQIARWEREQEQKRRDAEEKARREAQEKAEQEQLARAEEAEKRGDHEEAEHIIQQPIQPAPVVIPTEVPKIKGISIRQNWKARVVDETKVPREYLSVDMVKLNGLARAMKDQAKVSGVEFYSEDIVSAGASAY